MTSNLDLGRDPKAIRARKRPQTIAAAFARADGACETLEGPVHYRAGDAIVTGTQGERWPVERQKFLAAYEPEPPLAAGQDGQYVSRPREVLARRIEQAGQVTVGRASDTLRGEPGDWLVQYDDGSYGIIRSDIFASTYDVVD